MAAANRLNSKAGFTLVEVIAVLVIIAILVAVAVSRVGDNRSRVVAAADKLKVHLRHAQLLAMHSETSWGVSSDGSSYWLFTDGDTGNQRIFLGEEAVTVNLPDGVSLDGGFTVSFDSWGRPYDVADPSGASPVDTNQTLSVNSPGHSIAITITRETGFIP
ncbi:type II secretion system protein [Desulfurivibrio alkaliphilus]|uniref:Prepilin-type N-terminal cleavage/methylation domain-containing protein n=1 Tax=Desulfurivibrio alkaliphilus (strain DSM 19089 / UNIQEM U267 / AHT2) TaxID=589865 RepID=D6Z756_DESAT|nr:type II secretion system protein [Desulfurivibrio alkaliphilus]ADH87043.1 conserved hypothetical protein [Desulfurivibrio alkaliphilus AHT 2]